MKGDQAPCPACRAPLQRASSRWEVLACLACGGVWTDAAASRRITTTVDREIVSIAKEAAKLARETDSTYARISDVELQEARLCPICAGTLAQVRTAHVGLDICATHGTWFDKDELGRLSRNLEFERVSAAPPPAKPLREEEAPATSRNAEMLLTILGQGE
jgi:Zn-finger nucleic acid-binding protein